MKKFLMLLLCLSLTILPCTAFASSAQYSSTRSFIQILEDKGIVYDYRGVNDDGYERVSVDNDGEDFSYTLEYFFDDGLENASIRVWYILTYDQSDFRSLVEVCNELNASYKYVTFYCDTSDNTITASMDLIFRAYDVGEIVFEATLRMANILDEGYPLLAPYA